MRVEIPAFGWRPRPDQTPLWRYLESGGKRALIFAHRRWGKDEVALHWAAVSAFQSVGNIWHMLPEAAQARKAIWNAVNPHTGRRRIDEAFPPELRANTNDQEMFIRFVNGSTWQVVGSDNFNSLVGGAVNAITFSEWPIANPAAWAFMRPILRENGGWALFIGTPRGRNHAHNMLVGAKDDPNWFTQVLPASQTPVFSAKDLEEERAEYVRDYGEDVGQSFFDQEYGVSFDAAVLGAYYGREIAKLEQAGQVGEFVDHEPEYPVHTALDIGVGDNMAIWWFQPVLGQIRVLDCWAASGFTSAKYVELIEQRVREHGWQRGREFVPHDARARQWAVTNGETVAKSRIETLIEAGCRPVLVPDHTVDDGINATRRLLPSMWFHERCRTGLEALRLYRAEWDEKNRVLRKAPVHDWTSHTADAMRYLAMAYRAIVPEPIKVPDRILSVGAGNQVTLNELWTERKRRIGARENW